MSFTLLFTDEASDNLDRLKKLQKQYKSVRKALGWLETDPHHPSLHTHKYHSIKGINGEDIFEAYAENHTPAAYRIFWHDGPGKKIITIIAITKHP